MPCQNKQTGECVLLSKKPAECFGPHAFFKKDSITVTQLRNDPYAPKLTHVEIAKIVELLPKSKNHLSGPLFTRLMKIAPKSKTDGNNLWRLTCLYNKDIKKIKDHVLWDQANAFATDVRKGYEKI